MLLFSLVKETNQNGGQLCIYLKKNNDDLRFDVLIVVTGGVISLFRLSGHKGLERRNRVL
jgi:hypothetical protein